MTLINFLTRIHFADGVLEEALRSEVERLDRRHPLIIASARHFESEIGQSVCSCFGVRTKFNTYSNIKSISTEDGVGEIAETYLESDHDVIIAFGGDNAIDLAKIARLALSRREPVRKLISEEGGAHGIRYSQPDLIVVPDMSGISSSVSDHSGLKLNNGKLAVLQSRNMIPDVVICDPTVALGSSRQEGASAAAGVISRGVSAYFAKGYNPPADGLALDSLNRMVSNAYSALDQDELSARREMMAGCLNSALSMQKGLCAVHAVSSALASVAESEIDFGAASRLLLPLVVKYYEYEGNPRSDALKRSLMIEDDVALANGLEGLLKPLPLPQSLSDMGVPKARLKQAAKLAGSDRAIRNGPRKIVQKEILSMLEAVY